jgi:hypothetical protein
VVTAANDYLRLWAEVLYRVPFGCLPARIKSSDDVLHAAQLLEEFRRQLAKADAQEGHELSVTADFFCAAATRIRQLERKRNAPGALGGTGA